MRNSVPSLKHKRPAFAIGARVQVQPGGPHRYQIGTVEGMRSDQLSGKQVVVKLDCGIRFCFPPDTLCHAEED